MMSAMDATDQVGVAIIGAGFSGLAMAVQLRASGFDDFVLLERAGDIGGTWRDNAYPGCACDVPSHLYSFALDPNAEWSSTFSPQAEIQAYLRNVAVKRRVMERVRVNAEVTGARWDDEEQRWHIETARGRTSARVLIAAGGPLSEPSIPAIQGLQRFKGAMFHSANWDHAHDIAGERVAVIGTGASSIQFVPQIQPQVNALYVYQRTPPWIMPRRARRITAAERAVYRRVPAAQRLMRDGIYWARELYAIPLIRAQLAVATRQLGLAHLRRQVPDPVLRAKLTPTYAPGCKRILISNDYLPALGKPNVEVVTDGIAEVRDHSIVTTDGRERTVDTIIFGTGFHVTDPPIASRLRGQDGRTLSEVWDGGMQAYHGTAIAGFPNLFMLLGPNTGLGHTSVVLMAEWQAKYVSEALRYMRGHGVGAIEVRSAAQHAWTTQVQRAMQGTVWMAGGCKSWYLDRHGNNTALWPDFTFRFRRLLRHFDPESYHLRPLTPGRVQRPDDPLTVAA